MPDVKHPSLRVWCRPSTKRELYYPKNAFPQKPLQNTYFWSKGQGREGPNVEHFLPAPRVNALNWPGRSPCSAGIFKTMGLTHGSACPNFLGVDSKSIPFKKSFFSKTSCFSPPPPFFFFFSGFPKRSGSLESMEILGVDSLSSLFNHRSFQTPDPC